MLASHVSTANASCVRAARPSRAAKLAPRAMFGGSATKGSIYDIEVKDINSKPVKMDQYKGKVLLVVNLASACGFTPQYTALQQLQDKYNAKGFSVLGFPCNQFGAQEPGSNADIQKFAKERYNVKFPLFSKVDVNGSSADPLFNFLKEKQGGLLNSDIKWNFSKFLVSKDGSVVGRYPSTTTPEQISSDIEKYL